MDKKILQSILSKPFVLDDWQSLLTEVFGVKNFLQKPFEISLANNKKAESAFELGSFNTVDDRIIGLYLVKVKPEVWLERNKVGLRELLRAIYQFDVDGALIVFEQADKWRLSFVSEIRTFDAEGNITKKVTEPKRYTYMLGNEEKTKTPVDRLFSIKGKKLYLEEIRTVFSVEALNEEFYKIVARHFYKLVGATEGKGAKEISYERLLNLPIGKPLDNVSKKKYQEFAVRLIGRTVFCWFLKVKKSEAGISLLPEHLLSSEAVTKYPNYYHSILEKLFFQTLNTPMPERWKELPDGCEQIPFLNGGLFEPQPEDFYKPNATTGFSEHINTLLISDTWFKEFFENLEQYNFTIDENSVVDIEVSVDPEMLGRIFENLLAEIDPDSGETARKATGSFYTPREIVDYMATESLVLYLHNQTNIEKELLKPIFRIDSEVYFSKSDSEKILESLDRLKILDPACGSGAFPMGVLQKIVMALQKLDRNAVWWVTRQVAKNTDPTARKAVKEKLLQNAEYARKIGIIQSTLYGVDIQPIAAEISKLRCFLTLVVDENIDETKPNRGVEPLPNLEFKFVTADSLLQLHPEKQQTSLFDNRVELEKLQEIRLDYLQSYGSQKNELKEKFLALQKQIFQQQLTFGVSEDSRAFKISSWNPFKNEKVDWFDPLWMYGVNDFDIVIGNPPYLRVQGIDTLVKKKYEATYLSAKGAYDLYILFTERGQQLLREKGTLNFIQPDKWINGALGKGLRKITAPYIYKLISFKHYQVFNASTYSSLLWLTKKKREICAYAELDKDLLSNIQLQNWLNNLLDEDFTKIDNGKLDDGAWLFTKPNAAIILGKMNKHQRKAKDVFEQIYTGIQTSADNIYFLYGCVEHKNTITGLSKALNEIVEIEKFLIKPLLKGDDVHRYDKLTQTNFIVFPYEVKKGSDSNSVQILDVQTIKEKASNGWEYLSAFEKDLRKRENGKFDNNEWFQFSRNQGLRYENKPKLLCRDICQKSQFAFDEKGEFYTTTTVYGYIKNVNVNEDYKYFLAVLNSQLTWYFMKNTAAVLANGYYRYMPRYISEFPIPEASNKTQLPFIVLVDYILFIKALPVEIVINEHVPNRHLILLFEEVIDALVYELYFEDDFKKAGIGFMKFAQRDFKSIDGKGEKEGIDIIHNAYQILRERNNEIRNNLKLMDIKLADLIMPIKTAK
jgi:TaqI-like C-terminal specificity domain/Eco57I restriction-modification methylase